VNRYEALKHAVKAHAGQVDKCGAPYILHPIAVAEAIESPEAEWVFSPDPEDAVVVALLHDVLEDTSYEGYLAGIGYRQLRALRLVTRREETYAQYVNRICVEQYRDVMEIAATVKLADLWHNLSPERQDCLPEKERKGLEKRYLKARDRIWEALGYEWWPEGSKERST
jgi:(p)ppGpp synthase/HD superfamily hydrolase